MSFPGKGACKKVYAFISCNDSQSQLRQVIEVKSESDNEEVTEFWKSLEEEIGEPICVYTLGEYRQGNLNIPAPKVGLFYLTETALFFQTFPKANWFASVLGGFGKKKKDEQGQIFKILLNRIKKAYIQKPTFMEKLFSPKMPAVVVSYIDADDAEKEIMIVTDEKGTEIVNRITALNK